MNLNFSPNDKYFFKLAILVMVADLEPHETEYNLIYDAISQNIDLNLGEEDFHELVDEVNRNVYENRGLSETAKKYASFIESQELQLKILEFCKKVLWADGIKRPEEESVISILKKFWSLGE
tara:strand:+ start:938 stop:1303 length:366 start_codon:yes stop_codon:yes gene_type:complete